MVGQAENQNVKLIQYKWLILGKFKLHNYNFCIVVTSQFLSKTGKKRGLFFSKQLLNGTDARCYALATNVLATYEIDSSGLYYKTITIIIDAPSVVKSDAPNCSIIYGTGIINESHLRSSNDDRNSFIIQATGLLTMKVEESKS
jgi:hypothetical protein